MEKKRQQIYFSKLAAKEGSVEEVLLNAIILTVHYGVVLKWHLYLSHFIILFQPCEHVLRIYQLRHKIYSSILFQGDDNGPPPFSSFFPQIIVFCLAIKTNHSCWVIKFCKVAVGRMTQLLDWGFLLFLAIVLCRRFCAPCLIFV